MPSADPTLLVQFEETNGSGGVDRSDLRGRCVATSSPGKVVVVRVPQLSVDLQRVGFIDLTDVFRSV